MKNLILDKLIRRLLNGMVYRNCFRLVLRNFCKRLDNIYLKFCSYIRFLLKLFNFDFGDENSNRGYLSMVVF